MINIYCERLGPELWAEPVNALTNISFFIAAYGIWKLAGKRNILSVKSVWTLIVLMVSIGIGSSLFHTFATFWAKALDVLPILLFQIVYLWLYGRVVIKAKSTILIGLLIIFVISIYIGFQFRIPLNGSLAYAPTFILILSLGIYHYWQQKNKKTLLLWSTVVFLLALSFRTLDQAVCPYFSLGTHFIWHLTNGILLYMLAKAFVFNLPERS